MDKLELKDWCEVQRMFGAGKIVIYQPRMMTRVKYKKFGED